MHRLNSIRRRGADRFSRRIARVTASGDGVCLQGTACADPKGADEREADFAGFLAADFFLARDGRSDDFEASAEAAALFERLAFLAAALGLRARAVFLSLFFASLFAAARDVFFPALAFLAVGVFLGAVRAVFFFAGGLLVDASSSARLRARILAN